MLRYALTGSGYGDAIPQKGTRKEAREKGTCSFSFLPVSDWVTEKIPYLEFQVESMWLFLTIALWKYHLHYHKIHLNTMFSGFYHSEKYPIILLSSFRIFLRQCIDT